MYNGSEYPFIKGITIAPKWSEFEPQKDQYQWQLIDTTLENVLGSDQYVYIHFNLGPDSPKLVYDNGVPILVYVECS